MLECPAKLFVGLSISIVITGGSDIRLGEGVENESFLEQNTTGKVS